jgi:hypothetical protein
MVPSGGQELWSGGVRAAQDGVAVAMNTHHRVSG